MVCCRSLFSVLVDNPAGGAAVVTGSRSDPSPGTGPTVGP